LTAGDYEVNFQADTTGAVQFAVFVNATQVSNTVVGQAQAGQVVMSTFITVNTGDIVTICPADNSTNPYVPVPNAGGGSVSVSVTFKKLS
jgi:hypothetical protein